MAAKTDETVTISKEDFEFLKKCKEAQASGTIDPHGKNYLSTLTVHTATEDRNRKIIKQDL